MIDNEINRKQSSFAWKAEKYPKFFNKKPLLKLFSFLGSNYHHQDLKGKLFIDKSQGFLVNDRWGSTK